MTAGVARPRTSIAPIVGAAAVAVLVALLGAAPARSQNSSVPDEIRTDTDPTKPVFLTVRDEYYDLLNDAWGNAVILRADRLVLKQVGLPGKSHGFLTRVDLPFVTLDNGNSTRSGLGDFYGQALLIPSLSKLVTVAWGTGLVLPTATNTLGGGKWQVAPVLAPISFFGKRQGFVFVKFQDYISFAGDNDRSDIHYFLVTPTLLRRISRTWWIVADSESRTDWKKDNTTSYKSGFQLGKMFTSQFGLWTKLEVPWGPNRQGDWTLKLTALRTRY